MNQTEKFLWGGSGECENENCLHKYLYLFAHLQFCMSSGYYESKDE